MPQSRDITFDIMKGIGIILVMTCHFFGWNHPWLSASINSFHMPMFFIIAGYFSRSYVDVATTRLSIRHYFSRLYWPFAFTQSLLIIWFLLMFFARGDSYYPAFTNALSLMWADVYGPITPWGKLSIGGVWFLIALLVAKIFLLCISRAGRWAVPISIVLAGFSILLHKVFPYSIWCIGLGLTALPFVTLGWYIRQYDLPKWCRILALVFWPFSIIFAKMDMFDMIWNCFPLNLIGACGGAYFVYLISKGITYYVQPIGKMFACLGLWSLAIMCMHDFEITSHLTNHFMAFLPFPYPMWIKWIMRYFITIALAACVMKIPGIKKIFAK